MVATNLRIVVNQTALPIPQEYFGILTGEGVAEAIHHSFGIFKCPRSIRTERRRVGLAGRTDMAL